MEPTTLQPAIHACKNCGHSFQGSYCNQCGEKIVTDHDKNLLHFFEEGFHFITHFEGTFFTTIKTIFIHPGKLSLDYSGGIRKRYFRPLSLFLLLVVLYLIFPLFEGLNMHLKYYATSPVYGNYAAHKIQSVLLQKHISKEALAELFHHKAEKISKFLLVIIIPFSALFLWLFTFKKRPWFFDQMIVATEINCFFLIWGFMLLPLSLWGTEILYRWLSGHLYPASDGPVSLVMYLVFALYAAAAVSRYYGLKTGRAAGLSLLFMIAHYFIVLVLYKFLLFVLVINQV